MELLALGYTYFVIYGFYICDVLCLGQVNVSFKFLFTRVILSGGCSGICLFVLFFTLIFV